MKTSKTINPKFTPFTITIDVQSEDDRAILYKLFGYDVSVPEYIRELEGMTTDEFDELKKFMKAMANYLSA